jgi:hypothetical protein
MNVQIVRNSGFDLIENLRNSVARWASIALSDGPGEKGGWPLLATENPASSIRPFKQKTAPLRAAFGS